MVITLPNKLPQQQKEEEQKDHPETVKSLSIQQKQTLIVDKVPELQSISSISTNTALPTSEPKKVSIIQCNEQWKSMKQDATTQMKKNQKKIDCFVKEYLFKKVKFFNIEMMCYSKNVYSICQMVCTALNILEEERETFWSTYSCCVKKAIKVARNDAIAAMKLAFFRGKSHMRD